MADHFKVLISSRSIQKVIDEFRPVFAANDVGIVVPAVRERLNEEQLSEYVQDVDGVICGDDYFTERVLRSARRLKVISKWGTGIDSIDQAVCRELGIQVYNTPGAFTEPVADSVLAYILNHARQITVMDQKMRAGMWEKHLAYALNELTLGIIGVGAIGEAVARRAAAFGMTILGHDLRPLSDQAQRRYGVRPVDLPTLLEEADFVSLNCDLNRTSRGLIGSRELALMKPTAYLINTARGPVVDEPALISALQAGAIAGAGLDVFVDEPLPDDSPLRHLPMVVLAPHNANFSPRAHAAVHQNTVRQMIQGLKEYARAV
jgi:D-3-phosphoglycerate dehydrogenase / 2-oxoglutarate reductase